MGAKRVTILVPVRKAEELDRTALTSLKGQSQDDFDTVVVGIGCPSEPPPILLEFLPEAQYLSVPAGTRASEALNRGLHLCDTPLVAVVEPSLELDPNWLEMMQEPFGVDLNVFVTSGKVFSSREPPILESVGEGVDELGDRFSVAGGEADDDHWDLPREIFGPSPTAVLFRRKLFSLVGPFDGAYGAGGEMADLAFRARWQGMKTRYVPDAAAWRLPGAHPPAARPMALCADRLRLFFKCMPEPMIWLNGPRVLLRPIVSWNPLRVLRGTAFVLAFLRALPGLLSRRREVLSQARVDYRYLYLRMEAREPTGLLARGYRSAVEAAIGTHGPAAVRPKIVMRLPHSDDGDN
jgi:GT2 family glycosyltransferase